MHFFVPVFSQLADNEVVLLSGDTIKIKALKQSEITPESEKVNKRLMEIHDYLGVTSELGKIDSVISEKSTRFEKERDEIFKDIDEYSQREIQGLGIKWRRYISDLQKIQKTTSEIAKKLEKELEYVNVTKKTWQITYKKIKDNNGPAETIKWVYDGVQTLKKAEKDIKSVQNKNFKIQNRIANLINLSEDVSIKLTKAQLSWTLQFFKRDSPPIWKMSDTLQKQQSKPIHFSENLRSNIYSVGSFFYNNPKDISILIFIFVTLLSLYYFSYKKLLKIETKEDDIEKQKFVFSHYISASLILTVMSNIWISSERPLMVTQFLVVLLLFPTFIVFSKKISKRLRPYLYIVVLIFFIDEVQIFFGISNVYSRFLFLLKSGIVLWLFLLLSNPKGFVQKEVTGKIWKVAFKLSYLYTLIVIISIFTNIFGYVSLSALLLKATVSSLLFGIILSTVREILLRTFSYSYSTKTLLSVNMISNHVELIKKRTNQIITYYLAYLWLKISLGNFGLWKPFVIWFSDALKTNWEIGPVSISFEGIITFFLVLIVTFTLSKIITVILKEEVFPRVVLPRGVPGAITKVSSYMIIAYGIYVSLDSAGVDFHQFGLLAGALGVGIGFGLQNIVANFISGLILSFERPIQAGDTIEVGVLMGEVKDIGVRASTVKTFDGAEVIVPNSNLISNDVINWTLSDRKRRRIVKVGTAYGTDPHEVLELIYRVANEHPSVLKNPKPWATFDGFGDSSLNFTIRFWATFDSGMTIQSEVAMNIYDAFNEAGIKIPFPQQDLHIKSFDPTVQTTIYPWTVDKKQDITSQNKKSTTGGITRKPGKEDKPAE
jgi:small-conductance mechanosensitive channel